MTRPSEAEVDDALHVMADVVAMLGTHGYRSARADGLEAHDVLYRATRPRVFWLSKEVADALGVADSNVLRTPGVRELVVQELARPTKANPDRVVRLWDREQVLRLAEQRRARR